MTNAEKALEDKVSKKTKERWKPIKGFEECYEISDHGRIRSLRTEKIISTKNLNSGYSSVYLVRDGLRRRWKVHKLVAQHFLREPKSFEIINHIDNDRTNPHYKNLEWVTMRENLTHYIVTQKGKKSTGASFQSKTGTWRSMIRYEGKNRDLGRFKTEEEAAAAYIGALNILNIKNKYAEQIGKGAKS